ncbi:MAG: hypothetical protein KDJ73_03035 [Notoacmeibacter sp.]|nr:hypothetical protein [Notoacmeibacter sp.]MCC0033325.1 hypothetical protein [Brucellaceae bacterium]
MTRLRNALLAALALAAALAGTFLLATIGLAVLGGVVLAGVAGSIAMAVTARRHKPSAAHAYTVRKDARGTIIEM